MSDFKQERVDVEFDNFMYRVHEVNSIVKKLASKDKILNHMGTLEADKFLKDSGKKLPEDISEDDIQVQIKTDKSVINHEAFRREDNPETMSQEQFMKQVEKDANQRFQDRQIKKEKCETLKTQAVKAFRRGEFEKALSCYNKVDFKEYII
ncbi:uncharacterized protein LOC108743877 [Agrilus planipennis]|uniref:Uncharacterized protein LOC108743877 n=1 Tax=Agrilus planipennis TaxID=224129 RepID=A0A1W4XR68_AGRPL|nr:uncharacterized protein LOC108743877 [Agrilus planipennis]